MYAYQDGSNLLGPGTTNEEDSPEMFQILIWSKKSGTSTHPEAKKLEPGQHWQKSGIPDLTHYSQMEKEVDLSLTQMIWTSHPPTSCLSMSRSWSQNNNDGSNSTWSHCPPGQYALPTLNFHEHNTTLIGFTMSLFSHFHPEKSLSLHQLELQLL
jgi:hypothetical protein